MVCALVCFQWNFFFWRSLPSPRFHLTPVGLKYDSPQIAAILGGVSGRGSLSFILYLFFARGDCEQQFCCTCVAGRWYYFRSLCGGESDVRESKLRKRSRKLELQSENLKSSIDTVVVNIKNITCPRVDTKSIFEWWSRYLTSEPWERQNCAKSIISNNSINTIYLYVFFPFYFASFHFPCLCVPVCVLDDNVSAVLPFSDRNHLSICLSTWFLLIWCRVWESLLSFLSCLSNVFFVFPFPVFFVFSLSIRALSPPLGQLLV